MADAVPGSSVPDAPSTNTVDVPTSELSEHAQANGDTVTETATAPPADDSLRDPPPTDAPAGSDAAETATPASGKKEKRKSSTGGVPEHKVKKLNKKKSMPSLHLDCKPGQFYWARLKGYPPWPSIICDEQMLPELLLATRPVSTTRPDGSLRDDFKEGGKNARDRTFPIMFLSTNEFQWMVNTSLTPLDPEECKNPSSKSKLSKSLQDAYRIASEGHDLDYFKRILKEWQEEQARFEKELRELEEKEAAEAAEKAKEKEVAAAAKASEDKKIKKSRKSKGGDQDVDMEDAETPKSSKKRKKEVESDAEGTKPKKTPKVTKLNAPKTPNGEASAKSSAKAKKKVVQAPKEDVQDEKPQMTEQEKYAQRENAVLYLRHKLQKGFLSRDQAPQEAEMATMADHFHHLESYREIEPAIIRATKVHKVLKAIVKLAAIPKEEQYEFKKRSAAMLEIWNKRMEADGDGVTRPASAVEDTKAEPEAVPAAPEANGGKAAVPAATKVKDEDVEEKTEKKADDAVKQIDEKVGPTTDKLPEPAPEPVPATLDKLDRAGQSVNGVVDGEAWKTEASTETAVAEGS